MYYAFIDSTGAPGYRTLHYTFLFRQWPLLADAISMVYFTLLISLHADISLNFTRVYLDRMQDNYLERSIRIGATHSD